VARQDDDGIGFGVGFAAVAVLGALLVFFDLVRSLDTGGGKHPELIRGAGPIRLVSPRPRQDDVDGEERAAARRWGVVDGFSTRGVETEEDQAERRSLRRRLGYKLG
jgi:hypothetical protein